MNLMERFGKAKGGSVPKKEGVTQASSDRGMKEKEITTAQATEYFYAGPHSVAGFICYMHRKGEDVSLIASIIKEEVSWVEEVIKEAQEQGVYKYLVASFTTRE
jgi:hypothetical protein